MAKSLVENLSAKFDPERYDDTLSLRAARAHPLEGGGPAASGAVGARRPQVIDLMQALRESVERTQRARGSQRKGRREQEALASTSASATRKQTPEPFGGKRGRAKAPIFVVQRHDARRLHYDFRLERDGVARARGPSRRASRSSPGQQHLAVHVEDHPLEYASFEGEIPQGNYGAGTVEIWDHGTYELVEEKRDGGLTVRLHGERLEGTWTLVPAHLYGDEKNWLLLRKRDEGAPRVRRAATTGRCSRRWPRSCRRARAGCTRSKWDGYRALAYVRGGEAQARLAATATT